MTPKNARRSAAPQAAPAAPDPVIVVAGDVCIDWFAVPEPGLASDDRAGGATPANWRLRDGVRMFARPGGAWLLAELVSHVTGRQVFSQTVPSPLEHQGCEDGLHSIVDLAPFPASNSDKDRKSRKDYVWRVGAFRGYAGPSHEPSLSRSTPLEDDRQGASLVVLDDVGNGFRNDESRWPVALRREGVGPHIVWKLSRPIHGGPLGQHLLQKHRARTVVVLDIEDLRAEGAAVSRQLSWERTVGDLIHAFRYERIFAALRQFGHVIVRLDMEGAVHFEHRGSDAPGVQIVYLPTGIEGATRADVPGQMLGLGGAFVAQMTRALVDARGASDAAAISVGIRAGLTAARDLFRRGLGAASSPPTTLSASLRTGDTIDDDYAGLTVAPLIGRSLSSRLLDYVRTSPRETLADELLRRGIQPALPRTPVARFGGLETLDRSEIETYRAVRNLIGEYLALPSPERPLSIAVFGPPGSGKSFGVAQVAKSLSTPDRNVEKLDFNVSQFETAAQVTAAFHAVRDAAVRGNVPLVFFDEFDAAVRDQPLAWLKYFLAPMQDGKFTDGESVHLIGRAIFIFAGGTKHTLADFARLDDPTFIGAKGPDFVSRLRGFVDVRGTDRREPDDDLYVVRRAVLLRSMLTRKAPALVDAAGRLRLDRGVRRAFLRCRSFVHGARSMESIIDMSLLAGREVFERACLPSAQQLRLHVDADEFMDLVTQDVRLGEHRDRIGQAIHARFRREQRGKKKASDPSMQPWARLRENYREDNRQQADDIPAKLGLVDCGFRAMTGRRRPLTFTAVEIEILAAAEHERWNDSKRLQGYTYAPGPKDDAALTHSCLLPWSDLPDLEKEKDRDAARSIPVLMAQAGFEVYRLK